MSGYLMSLRGIGKRECAELRFVGQFSTRANTYYSQIPSLALAEVCEMDQGWLEVVTIAVVLGGLAALGVWLRLDEGRRRKGKR
ncbi:MAG TPA: hypothetical protein VFA75_16910 [Nevskia sp.]|nr:hypothetical protein [Nevskia sp.]